MGSLICFEFIGNRRDLESRAEYHDFRLLITPISGGLAGLCEIHDLSVLICELRSEPGTPFRISLTRPDELALLALFDAGLDPQRLNQYVMEAEGIMDGSIFFCEKAENRYYFLRKGSKKERLGLIRDPKAVTSDRTQFLAVLGEDVSIQQLDFSKFTF
jgi:hypothetical protein